MTLEKCILERGRKTRFGSRWPGQRCLSKTRGGTECQLPAYKNNGRCRLHGELSKGALSPEGLQRISQFNLKNGRHTKDKLWPYSLAAELDAIAITTLRDHLRKRLGEHLPYKERGRLLDEEKKQRARLRMALYDF